METLREAYRMAKGNHRAPGIDGVTFAAIEQSGVEEFLLQIRSELVEFRYLYLEPGKMREMTVEVNRVCDLQLPGKYRATLSRRSLKLPNDPVVSSNTITIEVQ
jgi:RNA-directed DNA polymerase